MSLYQWRPKYIQRKGTLIFYSRKMDAPRDIGSI